MLQWKHLFRNAHNDTIKTFVIARRKMVQLKHLFRQGQNGTIKTFVIARRTMAIDVWPLRGQETKKKRFHGSHVSNILGRKAHNGTIKTFVPQCAQIPHLTPSGSHVSSFLGRKAHNVTMKTFVIARRIMVQLKHFAPGGTNFPQNPTPDPLGVTRF
jgi:hypothetical protein